MLELAKALHSAIGTDSSRVFILVFALIGALIFGGLAWVVDRSYQNDKREKLHGVPASGPPTSASPSGDFSIRTSKPLALQLSASRSAKVASITVDTSLLQQFANDFSLIVIMRVVDNSVDALTDARLEKSQPFAITGEVRTIQVDLSDDFIRRADAVDQWFNEVSLGYYLALIPKHVRPEQIVTLPDITRLGGKQIQIKPEVEGVVRRPSKP